MLLYISSSPLLWRAAPGAGRYCPEWTDPLEDYMPGVTSLITAASVQQHQQHCAEYREDRIDTAGSDTPMALSVPETDHHPNNTSATAALWAGTLYRGTGGVVVVGVG